METKHYEEKETQGVSVSSSSNESSSSWMKLMLSCVSSAKEILDEIQPLQQQQPKESISTMEVDVSQQDSSSTHSSSLTPQTKSKKAKRCRQKPERVVHSSACVTTTQGFSLSFLCTTTKTKNKRRTKCERVVDGTVFVLSRLYPTSFFASNVCHTCSNR